MTLAPTYDDAPTLVLNQPRGQPNTLAVCALFRERGHLGLYCSTLHDNHPLFADELLWGQNIKTK